ncbi:histone-lysine N-methyltransferase 2A isoform X3 [Ambystoma mexicanum]|uniref:histone-lysine N-methyltransferase 2A isoform X3 n=1 Tax=Ambystoma mexicanum TaxID=8296 RepID=UPI0037E92AFC
MAHSSRWRFPARPGTGRRLLGPRARVAALLQPPGLVPGFDAALQVSAAIRANLRRWREALGAAGEQEEQFLGFGCDEVKLRSPTRTFTVTPSLRKPRGRPRASTVQSSSVSSKPSATLPPPTKPESKSVEKVKKAEAKPGEKRRGRPPIVHNVKFKLSQKKDAPELLKKKKEDRQNFKNVNDTPSTAFQHAAKIKKIRAGKLSPLKSKFKTGKLQIGRKSAVPIVRRRGRPPSSTRLKDASADTVVTPQLEKTQRPRKEKELEASLTKEAKAAFRQSPRRVKPVRIIPSTKRTDATIAKQLLQRAKKGAQKKIEKEAAKLQGRKGRTQVKHIRQFIMPVVSAISSRIIKTPKRFIEDEDYDPPVKITRLESTPNSRFSTASCGSSEKSSALSQHSSQLSSDDSRSSSPSVDTSTDSQASEELQALSEERSHTPDAHLPMPQPPSSEAESCERRSRRLAIPERSFGLRAAKRLASVQVSSQQQASSSPPPPLLTPTPALHHASSLSDHTPWLMPPTIPLTSSFMSSALPMHEKRRSILREPTFKWTSLKRSRSDLQCFSSAKYAKEGLIRKPIFDNFRPPPLTAEDVGLASASGFSPHGAVGPGRLFSHLHGGQRYDLHKRSPLLRAPRFTPSEAHSRIFESVTLPSAVGRLAGSASGVCSRRKNRRVFSPIRSEARSPSHSMRTRSRRFSNSELSSLTPQSPISSSLTSISVSSLTTSALNSTFTFSSSPLSPSGESTEKSPRLRKQTSTPTETFSSKSTAPLFPWFPSRPQTEKGRHNEDVPLELSKEKEPGRGLEKKSRERERSKEKENKRESCKDKQRKGSEMHGNAVHLPISRASKERVNTYDASASPFMKKTAGRKKAADTVVDIIPTGPALIDISAAKTKISKKVRVGLGKFSQEQHLTAPSVEKSPGFTPPASSVIRHVQPSISSMLAQVDKLPMTDKRVATLLKKAKAQLCKIEKSKSMKQPEQPKAQSQESDSSETSIRGPRIKHVCRRAAVALGRKRAVFPDDMPTLSALPWEEREKILSSMGNDDKSSIAGSEDAEPPAPPIKPVTRNKTLQDPPVKKGRRSRRCGQCPGCQVPEDCGLCTNCLDKPKFGGRNIKKQCCKMRKCQNLQWMPSKANLQKQAKVVKKKEKKNKSGEKKESHVGKNALDSGQKSEPPGDPTPKKSEPPPKVNEEEQEEASTPVPPPEPKQASSPTARKQCKTSPPQPPAPPLAPEASPAPPKKEMLKTTPSESKKKLSPPQPEPDSEQNKLKKLIPRPSVPMKQKLKEKLNEKPPPPNKPENGTLGTISNGCGSKQKPPTDGVHRIRVDFKEDCEVENVWGMGGLSILTSVPITPRVVCFLCASSGNVEFVYCQVCCEPFHKFCLEESEQPLDDQLENWCCRRCKFCHVCGRQHQATKQLLECNKCRNSYHPECLGPNYPTKPTKKKKVWICTKCVRCKSCGATTPGKGWEAQWSHDFSLCHDCAKLFAKGNFCPLCDKCYDDDDYESKMMQCGKCDRWVHSKCENLSDEMYEILSNLPESVAYTCINCTDNHPAEWRLALEKEVQTSLKQVLTALLNSRTTSHLLRYRQQTAKPPDLNPEPEESIPSRSSPEGPDPPVLTEVTKQEDQQALDLEGVKKKMDLGGYTAVLAFSDDIVKIIQAAINADGGHPEVKKANGMVKSFFIRQMERVFPWFGVKKSRFWEPNKAANNGMLPNAVLPPSLDHNYAQWQEREENNRSEQPPLMKKIIPAPKPKGLGDPESPKSGNPPTPPATGSDRCREDSPDLLVPPDVEDNRQCALCLKYGDDHANDAGRLLYIRQNEWTHVNCALWSAEVFEDDDGSLKNVHMAVIRGKQLRCEHCTRPGATVGCCLTSCTSNYHFMCSRAKNCVFLDDKKVYCQRHRDLIKGDMVTGDGFEVQRRVFVDFEGISLRRKFLNGLEPENVHMMIGSMTIDCLGILTDLSDCEDKLFPIGYQCSRVYWSTTDARKRCVYTCKIMECRPPASEPDINSTVEHDDNRTMSPIPALTDGALPSQTSSAWSSLRTYGNRNRLGNFRPKQRFPGSRPLPSAGSHTSVTHEIVTVGDPLLSSGFRSIGSRRHSASSLSPQQYKLRMIAPARTGCTSLRQIATSAPDISTKPDITSKHGTPAVPAITVSSDDVTSVKSLDVLPGSLHSLAATNLRQDSPPTASDVRTTVACASKPCPLDSVKCVEKLYSSPLNLAPKSPSMKSEKVKASNVKISDPSSQNLNSKMSSPSFAVITADSSVCKAGTFLDQASVAFNSKETLPLSQLNQESSKKEREQHKDTFAAEKPSPQSVELATILKTPVESNLSSTGKKELLLCPREKRQKSKRPLKERYRELHFSKFGNALSKKTPNEVGRSLDIKLGHQTLHQKLNHSSAFNVSTEKPGEHNQDVEGDPKGQANKADCSSKGSASSKKQTVKVTLTPLKMERDNQSSSLPTGQSSKSPSTRTDLGPITHTTPSSGSPSGNTADRISSSNAQESQVSTTYPTTPAQDLSPMIQDGNKAQDDGSFKRRYPRRSARARSNMFFGLTPLYGVRSYGEEDIPFFNNPTGKKRGKRSAEGQVDGADDLSTSSDEDDLYYYNFTRTVISSTAEERLRSHTLFREEDQCNLPKIPQLDGVDDGAESDTTMTTTTGKANPTAKRNSKENGTDTLKLQQSKEVVEKEHGPKESVSHKQLESKIENCHPVSRVKPQSQESLEAQLSSLESARRSQTSAPSDKNLLDTFSTELLKSDSDNNNSDDYGNILPSDIMDFVLKNTPSMQALGESPESSSSELLTLSEGLGLDNNRGKDMGLFEVFSQQLPTSEPGDSGVSSSVSAEEQFELPLELPSDLSVLTTRSPSMPSQSHNRLAVIAESQLSSSGDGSILAIPSTDSGEKNATVTEKSVASSEGESSLLSPGADSTPEDHMTPVQFIASHMDTEHIAISQGDQVESVQTVTQDLNRNTATPILQAPGSPTSTPQNQNYVKSSSDSPRPSQLSTTTIQAPAPQLKSTEKVLVVNQNMQPLYVLLPNGITQQIQLTPSVGSAGNVLETSSSVLSQMGGALTLAAGLNTGLPTSQSLFPPTSKGLLSIPHQPHLHSITSPSHTGFTAKVGSPTSGLLIGVQPAADSQNLVSETSQRTDLGDATATPAPSLNKKRPIPRPHSRKHKKLAPSGPPSAVTTSDIVSNMTLINFSPTQHTGGIPTQPSLIDLGTLNTSASHRTVPNIIKRSKSGVMYFEQQALLPQNIAAATSGIIGPEVGHLTAGSRSLTGLSSNPSVLNVVSMQTTTTSTSGGSIPGHLLGQNSVTLTSPGLLEASELGSIGNLLIKASQQGLGLQDQHTTLPPGATMFNQLKTAQSPSTAALTATSNLCLLPSAQTVGLTVTQSPSVHESPYQLHQHVTQMRASKVGVISGFDPSSTTPGQISRFPHLADVPSGTGLQQNKVSSVMHASSASPGGSPSSGQQSASSSIVCPTKHKPKMKRMQPAIEKGNGKKHKMMHARTTIPSEVHIPDAEATITSFITVSGNAVAQPDMPYSSEVEPPPPLKDQITPAGQITFSPESSWTQKVESSSDTEHGDSKPSDEDEGPFNSPWLVWLNQEQKRRGNIYEKKPKKGLVFEISSDDGFQICAESIEDAWKSLTDKVQEARSNARLKQLSFAGVNGLRMLGNLHHAVVFLIEQLYGAKHCRNYKFRFHKPQEANEPPLNPHGSARAEVHCRKSSFDMFNFLASKHRQPPDYNPNDEEEEEVQLKSARRATSMDLPMPMRFRHLKKTSREAVGVYRSPIHGRGLFCKRNIDAGEMVIEYSGNVIRSTLTDKREKYYDSKGIGCYMFRIDDSEVVDATMHGNAARFINHSCEPNCYSRVINIDGMKRIIIFAVRKIYRGEELTYDYKFPLEDARNKLPCNCGAKKCRKFLN